MSSTAGSRILSLHSLSSEKGRGGGHTTSQGVQVHKYADTGAEVSDWNESKGTGGGEEQSQEEEEQRQKEEQKQEEEEQRQEKEEQRQEKEEQCQEEEEQSQEEEQGQEEEEQSQEEEERMQEEEEDDIEVEVEKGNGPLTRGNIDMKVRSWYTTYEMT